MRRPLALAAAALASVGVLAACDKPVPEVTIQSGSTVTTVKHLSYCFDADHCRFNKSSGATLHVDRGATILVDVPKEVADGQWSVRSARFLGDGKATALQDPGVNSGIRKDTHVARVQVPVDADNYYLVITSATSDETGQWVAEIRVSG